VTDVPATLEYVCADNVRPLPRAFASQRTPAIEVSARALASYVGEYVAGSGAYTVSIRSNGQELIADVNGKGGVPLTALTATTFSASMLGTYEFRKDTAGHVTELAIHSIEGVTRAPRTPADAR